MLPELRVIGPALLPQAPLRILYMTCCPQTLITHQVSQASDAVLLAYKPQLGGISVSHVAQCMDTVDLDQRPEHNHNELDAQLSGSRPEQNHCQAEH